MKLARVGFDRVDVGRRDLKPRQTVVDAQFGGEPWRQHAADTSADAPPAPLGAKRPSEYGIECGDSS